jgi:ribonuclease Z
LNKGIKKVDLLFLGTSSGTPTKQRNVSALALQPENSKAWYLVDCGEGTQHQLLHSSLSVNTLKAILITHVHGDHCYGLVGLLASAAMLGRKESLLIIAPQAIETWVKATQQLTALFLPYPVEFLAVETLTTWQDENVLITPTLLSHRVPSYAYSFIENSQQASIDTQKLINEQVPQGEIWGKLKKGLNVEYQGKTLLSKDYLHYPYPARKIVVGGDNDQPELLEKACENAQVLVHESTYTQDVAVKVAATVQHSSALQVASFAQKVALPSLILTHFSARYQDNIHLSPSINDIYQEASTYYQGQLFLAEDFKRYRLSKVGQLTELI